MVLTKLCLGIFKFWNFDDFFFSFSLTWDRMGVKISKHYSSYKSWQTFFKIVLNFHTNGPGFLNLEVSDVFGRSVHCQKYNFQSTTSSTNCSQNLWGSIAHVSCQVCKFTVLRTTVFKQSAKVHRPLVWKCELQKLVINYIPPVFTLYTKDRWINQ